MDWLTLIGDGFLLFGAFFVFTGAAGVMRMPDFFSRLHPAGISDALGLPLILIGVMFHMEFGLVSIKIFLLMVFAMVTSATACHALAKVAIISGEIPRGYVKSNVNIVVDEEEGEEK